MTVEIDISKSNWEKIDNNFLFEGIYNKELEKMLLDTLSLEVQDFENWKFTEGIMDKAGMSENKKMEYFDKYCKAITYDRKETIDFIRGRVVYRDSSGYEPKENIPFLSGSYPLSYSFTTVIDVINHFFANTIPVLPLIDIPSDMREAAHYYYRHGFTPLPKCNPLVYDNHKHPCVKYIKYRDNRFIEEQLDIWNFKYGICLLGDKEHCYLDIDNHIGKENGVQYFDRVLLRGRHYERTLSGGYHIFGLGNLNSFAMQGVEIKGNKNLIVAYPSPGYKVNNFV